MADLDVVEGWSGPIDFVLKRDGTAVPLSTGDVVELLLKTRVGVLVNTSGDMSSSTSTGDGLVRYTPDAGDFKSALGPYLARFKVTDAVGAVVFFPNGKAQMWEVHSQ